MKNKGMYLTKRTSIPIFTFITLMLLSFGVSVKGQTYCTNTNTTSSAYYISSFSTTGGTTNITNNVSGFSTNGYGNFTTKNVAQLPNGSVNFSITETGGTMHFGIWVDWNQDGDFSDSGEEVYINNSTYNTTVTGSITVPITAIAGNTRMRVVGNEYGTVAPCIGTGYTECEDYTFKITAFPACTGTPSPGNTVTSSNSACSGVPFSLSMSNTISGYSGITYQWQSSLDSVTWIDIAGATAATYSTTQTVATYYRCLVTCTSSSLFAYSTAKYVTMNTISNCYCTNTNTVSPTFYITNFSTTGCATNITNNVSGFSANGYGDFTAKTVTQVQSGNVSFFVASASSGGNMHFGVWVDWNQDGDFSDPGEEVYINNTTYNLSVTGSFAVPLTATIGSTRMRVVGNENGNVAACTGTGYTECEDYTFNVTAITACTGTPTPGNTISSANLLCPSVPFTLSMSNALYYSGITYQWQSSADSLIWTDINGATATTYSNTQSASTYYRCLVTCTNSSLFAYSTKVYVTMNPLANCYCSSGATSNSDMDIINIKFGTINNSSASVSLTGTQGTATGTAGMYSNWKASSVPVPSLQLGTTEPFTVTIGGGIGYSHRVDVYIDFNQDGDFTDAGESFPIFGYSDPTLPKTTTSSIAIPLTAVTGTTFMRVVCVESASSNPCGTYSWGETEDYKINITPVPPCSAAPTPGNTVTSTNLLCPDIPFTLSMSNTPSGYTGINYQWQSSSDSVIWVDISGATAVTYATIQATTTYYRCMVTCSNSSLFGYSTAIRVSMNPICYCENQNTTSTSNYIDRFVTTLCPSNITNDSSGFSPNGYGLFTAMNVTQVQDGTVQYLIDGPGFNMKFGIWVDWNQDGDFSDSGEEMCNNSSYLSFISSSFKVPYNATPGATRMRVVESVSGFATACVGSGTSECEDYTFIVTALPACTGTPTGGTVWANSTYEEGCTGYVGQIGVTGSSASSGLTFQWQSSPTGNSPWTNIDGATEESLYLLTSGVYYRRMVTCTNSGLFDCSSSFLYTSSAPVNDECENAIPLTVNPSYDCPTYTSGTLACASTSPQLIFCTDYISSDVWYTFVATDTIHRISLLNVDYDTHLSFELYKGACGSFEIVKCSMGDESTVSGLTIGTTYYVRVYRVSSAQIYSFDICIGSFPHPETQLPCTNLGFESGLTGWYGTIGEPNDGAVGSASAVYMPEIYGITSTTSHTLMSSGTDPYGGFPMVFSGSQSLRLGNNATYEDYKAASIEQTFQVDTTNTEFALSYATVLTDDGGADNIQPYFKVEMYDQTGAAIASGMSLVVPPGGVGLYRSTIDTSVYYKPWSTVNVNLTPYIGQTVTVRMTSSDRIYGPSFGYAYLDCACSSSKIEPKVICLGQSDTLTAPAGAASYFWTPGGTITQSIIVSPTTSTTYTCHLISSGATPVNYSLSADVTVNNPGLVNASSNSPICAGANLNLTAAPSGATTYHWSGPNGFTSNLQNPIISTATVAAAGTYSVTASFAGGCIGTASTTVVIDGSGITNNTGATELTCALTSISVTATSTSATAYLWDGGASPTTDANTFTVPGTYNVSVTSINGCTTSSSITITQNITAPTPSITNNGPICENSDLILTGNGGVSYSWSGPDEFTSNIQNPTISNITLLDSGIYSVAITGANGCTATGQTTVVVNQRPIDAGTISGATTVCQGQNSVVYNVPQIIGAISYMWTLPNGATGTSLTNSITVNYGATASSGVISVYGINSCGNGNTATLTITVNAPPQAAGIITGAAAVCPGQNSVIYSAPAIINATSYIWTLPNGATGTSTTNSITVNYGLSAISGAISVYGANNCAIGAASSISINVNSLPSNAASIVGVDNVCQGQSSIVYSVQSIPNANSYVWTLPNGATGSSTTNNITVGYGMSAISGNIIVKGQNTCGFGASSSLPITVLSLPASSGLISGVSSVVPSQIGVDYSVPIINGATSYLWSLSSGMSGSSVTNSIVVNFNNTSLNDTICVKGVNACGEGVSACQIITKEDTADSFEICYVEFDTIMSKNKIVWATPPSNAQTINIYNEIATNTWGLIGSTPATQTRYIDMTSNPLSQSSAYKISMIDNLGVEGNKSQYHKTITLLSAYDQLNNTYGFTWSSYEGIVVPNYLLFGITESGAALQIASLSGTSNFYNYINPSSSFIKYFVGFYTPSCGSKTDYIVRSNFVNSINTGINDYQSPNLKIYPNPASNRLTIEMEGNNVELKYDVINDIGQVVFTGLIMNRCLVETSKFAPGVYLFKLEDGKTIKFIKEN